VSASLLDTHLPALSPGVALDPLALSRGTRAYLDAVHERLAERQAEGATGSEINSANSDTYDRLIRRLYETVETDHYTREGRLDPRVAVAAVGGYARREMSIGSDVDLLFLVEDEIDPLAAEVAERIQYCLWDARVEVGAAVRNVDQCVALGLEDLSALTAIQGVRFLAGDAGLFPTLTRAVTQRLIPDVPAFVDELVEVMQRRHERFGESLYLLQPNLKEGAGGLRDYHTAMWVARAVDPNVRELRDLLHVGLLTDSEMAAYRGGLDFLWRVRNGLHLLQKRKTDQMSFGHQEELASYFGLEEGAGDELAVERFMRRYYLHARAIQTFSEIVIEQCQARLRPRSAAEPPVETEDGFRIAGGQLEVPHSAHLREQPLRLLTAFAVSQDHDVPLSRTARRLIRENLHLIDDTFRRSPEAAAVLLRILASEHRVMRSLMAMNEVGVLGSYLPEWDHIVCRWQHVIYHTYTVDVHSIFLVEQLRRLWRGKFEQALPDLTELVREVADLPALFLGCLLHDIGKGFGVDHSSKGAVLARTCLERLALEPERIDRIIFIVEFHLLMSHVAQRRDLSDPKVIVEFARSVGDRENLRNLYLATFADMRASSDAAFTEWRRELLRELYVRTSEFLETGEDDPRRAMEQVEARVERRRAAAREEILALGVAAGRVDELFDSMPRRYFISHTPRQIARHARVVFSLGPERGLATAVREMRGGFSELIISTRDKHGLYGDISGCITGVGINILGSNVYTTRSGLALEIYRVTTPPGDEADRAGYWKRLDQVLLDVLDGRGSVSELQNARRAPVGSRRSPSRTPPTLSIRNDVSDFYTVIDVTADDRLGLLYELTRTLAEHDLEIFVSKASTVLDQVADTFYVKAASGKRLTDPEALARLEASVREVLGLGASDG
jgi:[protein-PII] uridylyltransferase